MYSRKFHHDVNNKVPIRFECCGLSSSGTLNHVQREL